jgi:predicted ester cyclase
MSDPTPSRIVPAVPPAEQVLQVERHDFVDLVPTDRLRSQSLRGFDPEYTDIVDYIVRCTHRIWDERDVGLIYSHYTHNSDVYYNLKSVHSREEIVRDTIERLAAFPERRGMATQVIWRGNDVDGFYTSHLVTGAGRHTQESSYGKPTGRSFNTRTVADCMVLENRIYREWIVNDGIGLIRQLGLDPHPIAEATARDMHARGQVQLDFGENRRLIGQYPPEAVADLSIAHTDGEATLLGWLHETFNRRMFGMIDRVYAANVLYHGTNLRNLYGRAAVLNRTLQLVATMPDCSYVPQHICSQPSDEGGEKIAVRWIMDGRHLGYGMLGAPTGHRIFLMGVSHYHIINGRVVEQWDVYDEMAMLTQIKLGAIAAGGLDP